MKSLRFTPAAIADLEGIWDYSAERWGVRQAESYTDALQGACEALGTGTRGGRPTDVRAGVLKALVGAHVIYFRDRGDHLSIIRILHQRQDVLRSM